MNSTSDVLGLIGKISSLSPRPVASEPEGILQNSFTALTQAAEKLFPLLFQNSHPQKSKFRREFAQILQDTELFLRYPFLYGRTSVGVLTGRGDASVDFLRQFCANNQTPLFAEQRSLPFVLYNGNRNEILAVNRDRNVIELTANEYEETVHLYKYGIQLRDLLYSFAFSIESCFPDSNILVFPFYASPYTREYKNLAVQCSAFFLLYEPQRDYKSQISLLRQVHVPVYLVTSSETPGASKTFDLLCNALAGIPVKRICPEECGRLLAQYNHAQHNFLLKDRLQPLFLEFLSYLQQLSKRYKQNIENLAHDSIFVEGPNDQNSQVRELRNQEIASLQSTMQLVQEVNSCGENLLEAASACDNALLNLQRLKYPFQTDSADTSILPAFLPLYRKIIRYALQCEEYSLANQYLQKLDDQSAPYAFIDSLYYDEGMRHALDQEHLEKLRKSPSDNPIVAHAQIRFFAQLGLLPSERDAIASLIDEKDRTVDEWYFAARDREVQESSDQAIPLYRKAFLAGSRDAGDWLANYYLGISEGYSREMKRLADALIPSAAFAYGQGCLQNNHYAQGITYLRIAVVLQYPPAILYYADMLYQECLQGKFVATKAKNAIFLYQAILEKNIVADFPKAKLGVLYYRLGNIERAKYFLEQDSSLPDAQYYLGCMYCDGNYVVPNYKLAKRYLKQAQQAGHEEAAELLNEILSKERKAETDKEDAKKHKYRKQADYSDDRKMESVSEGCFITTATCTTLGKPDTCDELTAFRKFRDEVLLASPAGRQLVDEYYHIAPAIVGYISQENDSAAFYKDLYDQYILPGYTALTKGNCDEAVQLYSRMVTSLAERYDISIQQSVKQISADPF